MLHRGIGLVFGKNEFYQKHKTGITRVFPFLLFLLISIVVLRGIIFSSYSIGFNHDWDFPMTSNSLKTFCLGSLFLWSNQNAGYGLVYPAENLLRYLLYPFSLLGLNGLFAINMILLLVFALGGYFMYSLLRYSFKLNYFPSVISGLFYATTPVIFNKVAAGQIPYTVAYALSPLIMFYFIKYTNEFKTKHLIITSLLLAFATIQIQFAVMLTLLLFFYAILVARMKISKIIKTFPFLIIVVSLIHSFWLLPAIINSSSFSATIKGASSISDLSTWGTSLTNAFRLIGYRSPHFETALSNYAYKNVWDLFSFLLVIFSFSSVLISKRRIPLFFSIVSIVTLIFTSISPFALLVYAIYSTFPIFNIFRETYHLAFLIGFSYSVMLAFSLQTIYNSKRLLKYLKTVIIIVILGAVILNDPFIYSGNFSGQVQQYQLNDQNLSIISGYLNSPGDYRVLYLPMIQPFKYDNLTYYGEDPVITYSQKPTIGNYVSSDFLNHIALDFYLPSSNLTNILELLSVKYVFFRDDLQSMLPSYLDEGKLPIGNGYYDIRSIWTNNNLLKTLMNQQNLNLSSSTENLLVFENNDSLPHIYPATIPIAVNGSTDELFSLLLSSTIGNLDNKAIFLSEQLNQGQWQFVKNNNETCFADEKMINVQSYNGSEKPFNWNTMPNDTIEMRYYSGWKSVIRTDGQENEDTLSFPSLAAAPYDFPSASSSGWSAQNSTLVYIETGEKPFEIDQVFENGAPISDIVGTWWETGWLGMGTKTMQYPVVIPPNQRAIMQSNHLINGSVTFQSSDLTSLSPDQIESDNPPIITFKEVNPTKYEVKVENATTPFFMVFNENYDPQWKAYIESNGADFGRVIANYPNTKVKEAGNEIKFTVEDISYLFSRPIDEQYHFMVNGYANAWYIDPQQMSNGDQQFTVTLYYLPQSYFYLGLSTTGITIATCVGYLLYNLKPRNSQIKKKLRMLLNRYARLNLSH